MEPAQLFLKTTLLIFAIIFISACGIKGPPLPPIKEETVQRQAEPAVASPLASADPTQKKKQ